MEKTLKERIVHLRAKFNKQGLDVDKLVAILKRDQLLPADQVAGIEKQPTSGAKMDRLLDEIVSAKDSTYHKLLKAVEQCVPPAVSPVFLTPPPYNHNHRSVAPSTESCSASLTSDSEDDVIRGRISGLTDGQGKELPTSYGKLTNIINTRHYDHSASSSFPALNDRYSPLPLVDEKTSERHSPLEFPRKQISSDNRLDWVHIKMQFDGALGELETLKQQNAEKISQLSVEAEYFRNMYKRSEAAVQQAQEELAVLRNVKALNVELVASKQQLQEDLEQLKKLREEEQQEMNELRSQHHKAIASLSGSGAGNSDVSMTDLYHASLQKFELLRKDYDEMRERYADLVAQHSSIRCQLEATGDLQKQLDEMRRERDATMRDKIAFQQHSTTVIQNLEQMIHENRKLKAALDNLQREHDSCSKDQRLSQSKQAQLQKDLHHAIADRDAAVMEYRQVMAEREIVHKEIEQQQDKLTQMSKLLDKCMKEKAAGEKEIEDLKQDLANSVAAREKYRLESQDVVELRSQLETERREHQRELQLMEQQRDIARKERHQALEQMDILIKETYEKTQKEKAEEMDQVAKETEMLKKQIDKIKHELTDAEQEAIVATRRRDWAFTEIDKTMQERESIRTLCDNLRRDRDRAVSELAKALRNFDECEKQKNDAVKELKEIRDKYDALVERDARRQQLNSVCHNHSRDSAIDADLQEWETETLEIELDGGDGHDIGFDIIGGKDSPMFPGDSTLFVSHVTKGGTAEGKVRVNDQLLKVNNIDTTNLEHRQAEQALHKHSRVTLVVRRRKMSAARIWQPQQLHLSCLKEGGIQMEQGLFISGVHSRRVIGKDGMLPSFGDRLISINHQTTERLGLQDAILLLEKSSQPMVLGVLRQASHISSTGSSPTPTSVLSRLAEHHSLTQSAAVSKSDTLATHNVKWENTFGDAVHDDSGSAKILRCSGSQTDSFDSPGPSPPKSSRNYVRRSMPVLDMVAEKFFRSRNKSNDRDTHRQHSRDEMCEKGGVKDPGRTDHDLECDSGDLNQPEAAMVSTSTQTPGAGGDSAAVGYPSSAFSNASPDTRAKSYKWDYEADSNSGTWPKTRTGLVITSTAPSTVTLAPAKERQSIKDPFIFRPPSQQNENGAQSRETFSVDRHNALHSQQSSVRSPVSIAASQALVPASKSQPHFSVRVMQGPSLAVVRPTIPKQWPRQGPSHPPPPQYSKCSQEALFTYHHPSLWHQPPSQPGPQYYPSSLRTVPKPTYSDSFPPGDLRPQHVTPKGVVKSLQSTPSSQYNQHSDKGPPGPPRLSRPSHPPPYCPIPLSPEDSSRVGRPASLDVPYPNRFMDTPGEEARVASPIGVAFGAGLSGGPTHSSSQHHYPTTNSSTSQHPSRPAVMNPRYSSPPGMFAAVSPEWEIERALFHPLLPARSVQDHHSSPSPSQQSFLGVDCITPTPSEEFGPSRYSRPTSHSPHGPPLSEMELQHMGPGGNAKHEKLLEFIRIPSGSNRSGSVEIVSDRSSPVSSIFRFEGADPTKGKRMSVSSNRDEYFYSPRFHETRTITFEKSCEPVGFKIQGGPAGGIFVSAVNDNSLASKAGLVIGDQLLEVCGINMRNATHEHAATVLRQCGNNLSMKVQYNPEKYMDDVDSSSTISAMSSYAASPTHSKLGSGGSEQSTPKHHTPQRSQSNSSADGTYERPHVVHFKRHKGERGPGFSIIGGNAVGIFVHEIQSTASAASVLQSGDLILEYNDVSFQGLTAERACLELNKPCSLMRLKVLSSSPKYSKIQAVPGDCFFVRANFSRSADGGDELDFRKDDILMVENTMYCGTLGLWLAWLVDEQGNKIRRGSIPSRFRLEDDIVLRRSLSENLSLGDSEETKGPWRGPGSARRSFFRRRRHQCNSSKDSREGSFSEASLNSESVPILDDSVLGYTQVEKVEHEQTRPVILLAPLADPLIRKLASASPDKYKFCEPSPGFMKDMEQSLAEGRVVDYWKKDDHVECVQVPRIRDICNEGIHCLMNVNPQAIERLHRLKIYPIVIFVHHKNHKQIKEIRDTQFMPEKLTSKAAKDIYDHFSKLEQDYSHLFSTVVQGGNLAEMSMRIKAAISTEQKKALWISLS